MVKNVAVFIPAHKLLVCRPLPRELIQPCVHAHSLVYVTKTADYDFMHILYIQVYTALHQCLEEFTPHIVYKSQSICHIRHFVE